LGVIGGINNSLKGFLYALCIRPDGSAGYIKSNDLLGEFYPGIGMFEADGTLTTHLDYATKYSPGQLIVDGRPALEVDDDAAEGLIGNDDFSGKINIHSINIEDQHNWSIWYSDSGGNLEQGQPLPGDGWVAHVGGPSIDEETGEVEGYWLGSVTGEDAWQNNEMSGQVVLGKFIDYYSPGPYEWNNIGTFEGDFLGTYDVNNSSWQGLSAGIATEEQLAFGGSFLGDFGYYNTELGELVHSESSMSAVLGGTGSLWANPQITIIGEFYNPDPDSYPLWTNDGSLQGQTDDDGAFLGVAGGINVNNSLRGLLNTFYMRDILPETCIQII